MDSSSILLQSARVAVIVAIGQHGGKKQSAKDRHHSEHTSEAHGGSII